jgi:hypothetical protein
MGGGSWDVGSYTARVQTAAAAGKSTFDYDTKIRSGRASGVNPLLDPTAVAGSASPFAGKVMREVCVTDEHPDPTAILIWLDVTGSNFEAAKTVHAKLPTLQAYLQQGQFCSDPQINVSAVGDANSDSYPLQFGQFESDNRLDDQIAALILEGNGGGQVHETYELGAYMAARHVHQEPYELFGKKGFVFFIGDEMPYEVINNDYTRGHYYSGHTLKSLTGDTLDEPLRSKVVFDELREKNHVFFLFQKQGSYSADQIVPAWERMIGRENVVMLDDADTVVEVIAALIARFEGDFDGDQTARAMIAAGGNATTVASAVKALARITPVRGGAVATTTGTLDITGDGADRI